MVHGWQDSEIRVIREKKIEPRALVAQICDQMEQRELVNQIGSKDQARCTYQIIHTQ